MALTRQGFAVNVKRRVCKGNLDREALNKEENYLPHESLKPSDQSFNRDEREDLTDR